MAVTESDAKVNADPGRQPRPTQKNPTPPGEGGAGGKAGVAMPA